MIVGINGRSNTSKSVGARALGGLGYAQFSLTDPLRAMLTAINPRLGITTMAKSTLYRNLAPLVADKGWEHALQHPTYRDEVRRLLADTGKGMRAVHGEDVLIDLLAARIVADLSFDGTSIPESADIVISDVRLPREAEWVRTHHGIIIEVVRQDAPSTISDRTEAPLPRHLVTRTVNHHGDDQEFAAAIIDSVYETPAVGQTTILPENVALLAGK